MRFTAKLVLSAISLVLMACAVAYVGAASHEEVAAETRGTPRSSSAPRITDQPQGIEPSTRVLSEGGVVLLGDVPHVRQKPDFCGEACVAMTLQWHGQRADQDWVFDQTGLRPESARGAFTREMVTALRRIGFDPGVVWHSVQVKQAEGQLAKLLDEMVTDLRRGTPSIVCMRVGSGSRASEHFRLVVGYDAKREQVLYHDPAVARGAYLRMDRKAFLADWPLKYGEDRWTVIRMRLEPAGRLRQGEAARGLTDADYCQQMMKVKEQVPAGFTVVLERPFVVAGDEAAEVVRRRSQQTVRWIVTHLKRMYFERDPDQVLTVWLFRDRASYRKHTKALFDYEPDTPYGYYSSSQGALVMNIGTGGGTLCHEIVHPFMASNFPQCPAWFNEGMGSLYEQCGERNGKLVGFTNWRLAGLQKAIEAGSVPSFRDLTATSTATFYGRGSGRNYAQARYLCYYLQQRDLLERYYHAFVKNHKQDPTGYNTLVDVLGESDMAAFQKRWERWVMGLRFGG